MTKEELEKEAKEYAEQCYGWTNNDLALDVAKATYITSAEPREKEIKSLGERCLQLQKDKGNLTDKVKELEAQLEKLKPYRCKNHFQVSETGSSVVCYRVYDCRSCGQFKEVRQK